MSMCGPGTLRSARGITHQPSSYRFREELEILLEVLRHQLLYLRLVQRLGAGRRRRAAGRSLLRRLLRGGL